MFNISGVGVMRLLFFFFFLPEVEGTEFMCSEREFTGQTLSDNMTSEQQEFKWAINTDSRHCGKRYNGAHQYGVPMKVSLLCRVFVFFADTPKSAGKKKEKIITITEDTVWETDGTVQIESLLKIYINDSIEY